MFYQTIKALLLFIAVLLMAAILVSVARSQVIESQGVEKAWCQQIYEQVQAVAPSKPLGPVKVVIEDKPEIKTGAVPCYPVLGLYDSQERVVTVRRDYLCPWLLAHEFAHVIYCDNYPLHPDAWADLTATMAVGKKPRWFPKDGS